MADEPQSVNDVLDRLRDLADRDADAKVKLGETIEALGSRSYGPVLVLVPLVEMSPLGGIPGVPTSLALVLALVAIQMLLGRRHLWLPGFLAKRGASGVSVKKAVATMRPMAQRLDRWFHGRLPALTKGPMTRIAAVAVLLLCCTVPPLELFPFATTIPMLAVLAFGLALLVRDGVLMMVACVLALLAFGGGLGWFFAGDRTGG